MIALFRRIRQRLLTQNQGRKYLLYAVGEILLVVIGILIALQVNNWNEERKERQEEKKYFYNLKNDLYSDMERLEYMMGISQDKVDAARRVKLKVDRDSVGSLYDFSQDLMDIIFVDEFRPDQNTYEEMKSSGNFSSIKNDSLKLKLINLKKTYTGIASAQEHVRYDFNVFLEDFEHYVDWGRYYNLDKSDIPNLEFVYDSVSIEKYAEEMKAEARELFRNKVFLNNIFLLEVNYGYNKNVFEQTKGQVVEIIEILDKELMEE